MQVCDATEIHRDRYIYSTKQGLYISATSQGCISLLHHRSVYLCYTTEPALYHCYATEPGCVSATSQMCISVASQTCISLLHHRYLCYITGLYISSTTQGLYISATSQGLYISATSHHISKEIMIRSLHKQLEHNNNKKFMYRVLNNEAPEYISNLTCTNTVPHAIPALGTITLVWLFG